MARTWSRASLPIVIKGDQRRMWTILASIWVVALMPASLWVLFHPEIGGKAFAIATIILVVLPASAAIEYRRTRYRIGLRITEEGVAIENGSRVDFDRLTACSGFYAVCYALHWKATTGDGLKKRGIGPGLGLSRRELKSLSVFLNELSAQARRQRWDDGRAKPGHDAHLSGSLP